MLCILMLLQIFITKKWIGKSRNGGVTDYRRQWRHTGATGAHTEGKTVRTTFHSASFSNYAEFVYKLIKTTLELLQETDSTDL